VPTAISAAALLLAMLTTTLDEEWDFSGLAGAPLGYTGGADGARALLITIAGSIITVAGVSYSITIAVLALSSMQFGPRLIRNFVRDISNQVVLGAFIATFLFNMVASCQDRAGSRAGPLPVCSRGFLARPRQPRAAHLLRSARGSLDSGDERDRVDRQGP
jgi:hypothetical protein